MAAVSSNAPVRANGKTRRNVARHLDSSCASRTLTPVIRLHRFCALLLLALWLPATLHCDFQTAGLDELFACADEHHSSPADAKDNCSTVESGWFQRLAAASLPAPALVVVPVVFLAPAPGLLTPPDPRLGERVAAPPEIARTWHFSARAAPPPRAPSLAS